MFGVIGRFVIDSIVIFDDAVTNLIVAAIVGSISYILSYRITGSAYSNGVISSKQEGCLIHWLIRIIVFIILANVIRLVSFILR